MGRAEWPKLCGNLGRFASQGNHGGAGLGCGRKVQGERRQALLLRGLGPLRGGANNQRHKTDESTQPKVDQRLPRWPCFV
jgi:hypothetical protein